MAAAHPVFVTFNALSNQKKGLTPRRMSALERSKPLRGLRQREHGEDAAELGVVLQLLVAAHSAQAVGVLLEARGKADAGPTADAGEHANVLLALVLPGITLPMMPEAVLNLYSSLLMSLASTHFR